MPHDKPDRTMGDILNEILISRGAPKEKYSLKVPTVKILWESRPLFLKQKNIISELKDTLNSIKEYNDKILVERDNDPRYIDLIEQLITDISRAVKAGLIWHQLVSDIVYTHKALGSKEILRKIKRGWETGVKCPLTITDLKFINRLEEIAEYRIEGKSWPQIRLVLMKSKIIKKMTWQALQKKFKKAWEEAFKKVNKKPPPVP